MAWDDPPKWNNEIHFLGPYKTLYEIQMEFAEMGKEEPPWSLHGWEKIDGEWVACLCRSVDRVEDEPKKEFSK